MPSTDSQCRHASSTSIVVTVAGLLTRPFHEAFSSEELSPEGVTQENTEGEGLVRTAQ